MNRVCVFAGELGDFIVLIWPNAAPEEETLRQSSIRQQLPGLADLDHLNSYTEDKTFMDHKGKQIGASRNFQGFQKIAVHFHRHHHHRGP